MVGTGPLAKHDAADMLLRELKVDTGRYGIDALVLVSTLKLKTILP